MTLNQRLLNILVSADQFIFSIVTFGGANPDETISAASWRWERNGLKRGKILRPIIDYIFLKLFNDVNHCEESYKSEKEGKQLPAEYNE